MLPKGAVCLIDVEDVSLPPPGTIVVPLVEVCPEAAHYFRTMRETMSVPERRLDYEALKNQKVYADPGL
eukprot:1777789-Heterocapsa_arctica.AAC.1